jgi:F420 biosynthesis protein FbiB-like protein
MDVLPLLQSRRSIRQFTAQPIDRAILETVLTAALWSPSAHNRQPWRFAVVTTKDTQHALASAMGARLRADLRRDGLPDDKIEQDAARSYQRLTTAAALVVVSLTMRDMDSYADVTRQQHEHTMAIQSTAMAGQNLLLMAHSLGLAACWMCAPLFCGEIVREALVLPDDWQPQGVVALGYPAQTREKTREPLETRVLWR